MSKKISVYYYVGKDNLPFPINKKKSGDGAKLHVIDVLEKEIYIDKKTGKRYYKMVCENGTIVDLLLGYQSSYDDYSDDDYEYEKETGRCRYCGAYLYECSCDANYVVD